LLVGSLQWALREAGHEVDELRMPFDFMPHEALLRSMEDWETRDLCDGRADLVICTKFPTYALPHPRKVLWLMHQHRAAFELWRTPYDGGLSGSEQGHTVRDRILAFDARHLASIARRFTIGRRVSERLAESCQLASEPLWHPPASPGRFHCLPGEDFVLVPGRLETLKRQELLLRALTHVRSRLAAVFVGEGGARAQLEQVVERLGLRGRVHFLGYTSPDELRGLYARCRAVWYGPFDEDYGYVTLEAMLSSKPVLTCTDSGGPLEFVVDGETGFVTEPDPAAVATRLDELAGDPLRAASMGYAGRELYLGMEITWQSVVERLTAT
jgi:glycosyltransferase involved in cell wall biosynthesis